MGRQGILEPPEAASGRVDMLAVGSKTREGKQEAATPSISESDKSQAHLAISHLGLTERKPVGHQADVLFLLSNFRRGSRIWTQ